MKSIGITGGVGAGKSAVLAYLKERYQAYLIVADDLAKELEEPGRVCYTALTEEFGEGILGEDGRIDKQRFAALIFSDPGARAKVNAIVHPAVKTEILRRMEEQEKAGTGLFVVEAALLIEEGYDRILDELWYVFAPEVVRRERLKDTRGYTDEKIDGIFASQKTEAEFRSACRHVIDNGTSLEDMQRQIDRLLEEAENVDWYKCPAGREGSYHI